MGKYFSTIKVKKGLLVATILFLSIQFYRPHKNNYIINKNNDFLEINNAPQNIRKLVIRSCYDCHSNQTNYQWYDNIAPISWWVDNTIKKGKTAINLSDWEHTDAQKRLSFLSASVFDIATGRMPTHNYLKFKPHARFTPKEEQQLIDWMNNIDRFNPYFNINEH